MRNPFRWALPSLVASFCLGSAASVRGQDVAQGLINYWTLDGDALDTAGTYAGNTSTNASNGAFSGTAGTVSYATGLFGQAAYFERSIANDGKIEITDAAAGTDTDRSGLDVSISVWVQADTGDLQQTGWQAIIAHGEGNDYRMAEDNGGNSTNGASYAGGTGDIRHIGGNLYDGNWHHIVATTTNGAGTELFVNGISVAT